MDGLALTQASSPTIYLAGAKQLITFQEGHKLERHAVSDLSEKLALAGDNLYFLIGNCIKKVSLLDFLVSPAAGVCEAKGTGLQDGSLEQALFYAPKGIVAGKDGVLYVADTYNRRVRKVSDQKVSTLAGKWIGTDHPLQGLNLFCPAGICTVGVLKDASSNVTYILEGDENDGIPSRAAFLTDDKPPVGESAFRRVALIQDGPPSTATFWRPEAIQVDAKGNLYILDRLAKQDQIRKVTPAGEVTTLIANTNPLAAQEHVAHENDGYPQAQYTQEHLSHVPESIKAFTLTANKLYVLGASLFQLNLDTGEWKVVIDRQLLAPFQKDTDSNNPAFQIKSLATDADGNLYILQSTLNGTHTLNQLLKLSALNN